MGDDVGLVGQHGLDHAGGRVLGGGQHRRHHRVALDHGVEVAVVGDGSAQVGGLGRLAGLEVTGDHPRREDHRHADAVVGELEPQRLGQAPHRELARLVRAEPAGRVEDRRRRGERQPWMLGPAQQWEKGARDAGRSGDVDVEQPPPLVVGERLRPRRRAARRRSTPRGRRRRSARRPRRPRPRRSRRRRRRPPGPASTHRAPRRHALLPRWRARRRGRAARHPSPELAAQFPLRLR